MLARKRSASRLTPPLLALLTACGAPGAAPVEPDPAAISAPPAPPASAEPSPVPGAGAPAPDSGPAATGELIGQAIEDKPTPAADAKNAERDAQLAAAVLMKSGHKECLKGAREKAKKPDWKPVHYEIVLTLRSDGGVLKVDADKTKTESSEPDFVPCVVKKLRAGSFPAPGREVTARLIYPDA